MDKYTKDTSGFLDFFSDLEDHRIDRHKKYSVAEIMLVTLCGIVCGCDGWEDIEDYGEINIEYLRQYLPYSNGSPSDDTLRRFFRRLNPAVFQEKFISWVRTLQFPGGKTIAIDGKISRHSFDSEKAALHTVSAFATEAKLVLAQAKISDKSNEITAIPELLSWLDLQGSIITIDAMGCQREVAAQIVDGQGDYILALKGNQRLLHADVKEVFEDEELLKELKVDIYIDFDKDHGRIEERICKALLIPKTLADEHKWPGLKSIVEISSTRDIKGKIEKEKRYYITSLDPNPKVLCEKIRGHWSIENSLHWIMDMSFHDDASRIRKGNAPQNIGIIKHTALNMLQMYKTKRQSIKRLRKMAGWSTNILTDILNQKI